MRRLIIFLSSFSIALMAGIAALPGFAEDIEVYKDQVITTISSDENRPNILFVLDRSSSMAYYEYDAQGNKLYNKTKRIERLTEALLQVLDDPTMDKANIGLATFSNNIGELTARGAAINFPIADVNSDANEIYGEEDTPLPVSQPISESSDDAEESQSGTVVVDSANLEMVTTLPPDMKKEAVEIYTTVAQPVTDDVSRIEVRTAGVFDRTAYNVAREILGGGSKPAGTMCFGFGSTWLGGGGSSKPADATSPLWGDGIVGMRFTGFTIPKGATILDSKIEFTNNTLANTSKTNLTIYGTANPTAFQIPWGVGKSDKKDHPAVMKNTDMCSDIALPSNLVPAYPAAASQITKNWSKTENYALWTDQQMGNWAASGRYATSDLSAIMQEIVEKNSDLNKDTTSVGFQFIRTDHVPTFNASSFDINAGRRFLELDDWAQNKATSSQMPKLTISYTMDPPQNQTVGLRFQTINIPSGATIRSAVLQFSSGESKATAANLVIRAEKTGDAQPFEAKDNNITSRTPSTASVQWTPTEWVKGQTYNSPELKDVVQEVVKQSSWCGGNSMAFLISSDKTGLRNALAFDYVDSTGNETWAPPTLKIEYELPSSTTKGCSKSIFTTSVKSALDDAEEELTDQSGSKTGTLYLKDITGAMEMGVYETPRMIGVRFNSIPIAKGSTIAKAQLVFNGKTDTDASIKAANLKISGELVANSSTFGALAADGKSYSANSGELSNRPKTATVAWSIDASTPWLSGKTYTSPDLKTVVQAIVNQGGWKANNSMSFFVEGTGVRKTFAYENNPLKSVSLRIEVLGPLASSDGSTLTTVRERLKQKVLQMSNGIGGSTNLVPAVYEMAQYFSGAKVSYGQSRYDPASKNYTYASKLGANQLLAFYADAAKHRISHPGSQTGGRVVTPAGCTSSDPWSPNCADEKYEGSPTYIKPKDAKCAGNYMIFLTDGIATINGAQDNVQRMVGGSCMATTSDGGALTKYEQCGPDVIKFLNTKYNVTTHTIGFSLGTAYTNAQLNADGTKAKDAKGNIITTKTWVEDTLVTANNKSAMAYLKEWAKQGKGNFHEASSVSELVTAFTNIVNAAIVESTSYTAPSVSVNAFNRIYNDKDVYFSIFKPGQTPLWDGNVKKYTIGDGGKVLDKNGNVATDSAGNFLEDASSYWSSGDAMKVTQGGAGEVLNNNIYSRKIFTFLGDSKYTNVAAGKEAEKAKIINITKDKSNEIVATNKLLTKQLLLGTPNATDAQANSEMSDADREDLINWIRGNDRWAFGDPLHSSAVSVTYSTTKKYLFVGTNDGLIRMINAESGKEEWAFLPPELLAIQKTLKENEPNGERIYGIDATATKIERSKDGTPSRVLVIFPMRSGGRNIYALDVTTPLDPKLAWVIKGGTGVDKTGKANTTCPAGAADCTPGYERLGLTWSAPREINVKLENCPQGKSTGCTALVFGGGYNNGAEKNELAKDVKSGCTSNIGNAVYLVDAATGIRMWWASNSGSGADLELPGMNCEIPSEIAAYDSNLDSSPDTLYFGDLGGNVWRIDLNDGIDEAPKPFGSNHHSQVAKGSIGGKLAELSDGTVQGKRQFFYAPSVIRGTDTKYSSVGDHRLVTIVSGTRSNPLNKSIQNHFYALRDLSVNGLTVASGSEKQGGVAMQGGDRFKTMKLTDLADITDDLIQTGENEAAQALSDGQDYKTSGTYETKLKELQGKLGWYLKLVDTETQTWKGEKGFSSPIIFKGKVIFATYIPANEVTVSDPNSCSFSFSDGRSRWYVLNLQNGGAAYDFSDATSGNSAQAVDGTTVFGEANDRSTDNGHGVNTDLALFVSTDGVRVISNNLSSLEKVIFDNEVEPTFWMQEK